MNDHERECYQRAKMRHMEAVTEGTGYRHKPRRPRMSLDHMSPLGRTITTHRLERAWTLAELAKESTVPVYTISKILNKRADTVEDGYLEKLATAFGIEVRELTHPNKPKPPSRRDMVPPERLRFLMDRANLGVAALCRLSGLSRPTIDNALKGSRPLSTRSAKKLAPILKTYPAKLMTIPTATAAAIEEPQLEDEVAEAAAPPPAEESSEQPHLASDILLSNIRRLARAKGWSDRDVGRRAGVYQNFVANLAVRGGIPKATVLKQVADALETTVDVLLAGTSVQPAPAAPPPAPVETYGAVVVADEPPAAELVEADQVTFVGRVEIEDGIPLPASFRLSAEMYRLDEMKPGQSIKAVVPWGLPFDVFKNRFAVMVHHAQTKNGFWFHSEQSPDRTFIRLWRVI